MPEYLPMWMLKEKKFPFSQIEMKKGFSGLWCQWYRNGNIDCVGNFLDGKLNGKLEEWFKKGHKGFVGSYINDVKEGQHERWYRNGNKMYIIIYDKGKINSMSGWNKDGSDNHGKISHWFSSGAKKIDRVWKNGKLISSIEWNENWSLKMKSYYDENGQFLKREFYQNNKIVNTEFRK